MSCLPLKCKEVSIGEHHVYCFVQCLLRPMLKRTCTRIDYTCTCPFKHRPKQTAESSQSPFVDKH